MILDPAGVPDVTMADDGMKTNQSLQFKNVQAGELPPVSNLLGSHSFSLQILGPVTPLGLS